MKTESTHSKRIIECPYCRNIMDCCNDLASSARMYQYKCRVCKSTGPMAGSREEAHDLCIALWDYIDSLRR